MIIKRLLMYTEKYKFFIFGAFLCSVISVCLMLYTPVLIGNAIDFIIEEGNVDFVSIFPILVKLVCIIAGSAVFQWLTAFCTNKAAYKTVQDLRVDVYKRINYLPLKYIDTHSHGDIISRVINDVDQVSDGLLQGLTQLFTGIVTIVGTFIFMLSINAVITLVVVVATPLSLFVASFIARHSHRMFKKQQQTQGELTGHIEELVGNQKLVKTFCYENRALEKFQEINLRLYDCGQKAQFYSSLSNPSTRFVNGIVYTATAVAGALCAVTGWPAPFTIGKIASFLSYANQYTKPFNEITSVITQVQAAFAAVERLFEILDEEGEMMEADRSVECTINKTAQKITADKIYFSYDSKTDIIKDMSFNVKPGEKIAVVGPTGCGKTTLINLLMRFYDVSGGSIDIDNVNIKEISRDTLRCKFGMVLQDTWLFTGTVRDNIAYGRPGASHDEITAAAKAAHADYFITKLPQGYDTIITEDGGNISQGQKQLLCIARVMLTNPPMLILDEATSNIDTRTERYVQRAFDKMMEGKTCFIVAHRLSTIREADRILVMNDGRIIEEGNHEELILKNGFYSKLLLTEE